MIPNQWYIIAESKEVKKRKLTGLTRMGEKMVLWRNSHGQVTCMSDICPHRGAALSVGRLLGDSIECPFHGFQYDSTGACLLIPANGRLASIPKAFKIRTYPTREQHGFIYIWWGEPSAQFPPVPFFESIRDDFSYSTIKDHWNIHYSRAIENQLDVIHLPFIHKTTIGRGNHTLVNGPIHRLVPQEGNSDILEIWVYNDVDRGQTPQKASEIPKPDRRPFLQFRFPNIWQNWISDGFRVFVAFVPIDSENTILYLRNYQNTIKTPILREFVNAFGNLGNFVIERQDKRVVITQRPKKAELRIGEKLIQGDGPIIEYRRRRQELIEAAQQ